MTETDLALLCWTRADARAVDTGRPVRAEARVAGAPPWTRPRSGSAGQLLGKRPASHTPVTTPHGSAEAQVRAVCE